MPLLLVPEHGLHILRPLGDFDGEVMLEEMQRIAALHPEAFHQHSVVDQRQYFGVPDFQQICRMAEVSRSSPDTGLPRRRVAVVSLDRGMRFIQALAAQVFHGHEISLHECPHAAYLAASDGQEPSAAARAFLELDGA